jgi:hypothetical protein
VLLSGNSYRNSSTAFGPFALGIYGGAVAASVSYFLAEYSTLIFDRSSRDWQNVLIVEDSFPLARLLLHDVVVDYSLAMPGESYRAGGSAFPYLLFLSGEQMSINLARVRIRVTTSGLDKPDAGRVHVLYLGGAPTLPTGRSRLSGSISDLLVESLLGDDDPIGIRLGDFLDVDPELVFSNCDLSALPDQSTAYIVDSGVRNAVGVTCADRGSPATVCPRPPN